ncbi:MAG: TonB-dependent receptor, partial [Ferruginibacter sp.]
FGATFNPTHNFNAKFNISTGFRSGNLAELSSNGLHEGTLRWEVGDPELKIEQNFNTEISLAYTSALSFSVAAFYNHFNNYIFLNPTGTQYLGFDFYRYQQSNAGLYGGEASVGLHLPAVKWFYYHTDFSTVTGKLANKNYLPFIPANKFHHEAEAVFIRSAKIKKISFNVSVDDVQAQNHPAQFETPTTGYTLLNAGVSGVVYAGKNDITISIAGNNLLNKNYYDHLSRFKDYFIHNIGRNIAININIPFTIN